MPEKELQGFFQDRLDRALSGLALKPEELGAIVPDHSRIPPSAALDHHLGRITGPNLTLRYMTRAPAQRIKPIAT